MKDVAVIGGGRWGKNHVKTFMRLGRLNTLCDFDTNLLEDYQRQYPHLQTETQYERVLSNPAISKIVIATSAKTHYTLAKQALLSQKDVFVEKPFCFKSKEAQELKDLSNLKKRIVMVGHLLHYHPCVEKIKELIQKNILGELNYITSNRLNLGRFRNVENSLWSFAPHDVSLIISLSNDPEIENVHCTGGDYLQKGIYDTSLTAIKFKGGLRAHVHASWLHPFQERKVTIVGSKSMLVFDDSLNWSQKLALYEGYLSKTDQPMPNPQKVSPSYIEVPEKEPLMQEVLHFLECCQTRQSALTDAHEGLKVVQVLEKAQESLDQQFVPSACGTL
jgi:UDP-2-acetamido-3-amino-2,3-dideoxy-glucuronate N-acetyltransferase